MSGLSLFASGNAQNHSALIVAMMGITVAIVEITMMSDIIVPLVFGYITIAAASVPFVAMSKIGYGDPNWLRYCIFWPAYVLHWLIRNAILAVQGK